MAVPVDSSCSSEPVIGARPRRRRLASLVAVAALAASAAAGAASGSGWRTATAAGGACPCSLFASTAVPGTPSDPDDQASQGGIEVGVRFSADVAGFVSAVRFYRGAGNAGVHVATLWDANGNVVSTAGAGHSFGGETDTGWQTLVFRLPVAIAAHTEYVAGYHSDFGSYSSDTGFFDAPLAAPPLHASTGVYAYGAERFPTSTFEASNYWVDVQFDTHVTPAITAAAPAPNDLGVPVGAQPDSSGTIQATFDEAVVPSSVHMDLRAPDGSAVAGSVAYSMQMPGPSGTFTPSAALAPGTTYTLTVSGATDAAGFAMSTQTWRFTTTRPCPCSLFPSFVAPETPSSGDAQPVELGMTFATDVPGAVAGVRFYKASENTGTHVGELWTAGGRLLASATFSGESGSGWQEVRFAAPVTLDNRNAYIVSYHTDAGNYSETDDGFQVLSAVDYLPGFSGGRALAGLSGSYAYGPAGSFPNQTFHAANYWVDVLFTPA